MIPTARRVAFFAFLLCSPALYGAPGYEDNRAFFKQHFLAGHRESEAGSGSNDRAIEHLSKIRDVSAPVRDYVLYFLGRAYVKKGRCEEAGSVFEILSRYPDSRWHAAAKSFEGGDRCRLDWPAAESQGGDAGCLGRSLADERADCFFKSRQYGEAKKIYKTLIGKAQASSKSQDLFNLIRLSQAAARNQDLEEAITANEILRGRYPGSKEAQDAHRKIAFLYLDAGKYAKAAQILREILGEAHLSVEERQKALERLGWCHYRMKEYAKAVSVLEERPSPFGLYWKGKSLAASGKKSQAKEVLAGLAEQYSKNYYGVRALEYLHAGSKKQPAVFQDWWRPMRDSLRWEKQEEKAREEESLDRIVQLSDLELKKDAAAELRRLRAKTGQDLPADPKLIRKTRDGYVFEVRSVAEEDSEYRMPHAGFLYSLLKQQAISNVDPFFLYGIMRQESRFRANALSPVGAIGLLQIMPYTGRKLASDADWEGFQTNWLYDPLTNIELSVSYLNRLSRLFNQKWYAMAASYNAGEQVVSKWLTARAGLTEEEFIEEIPYTETRDYVKKVYTNWRAYRAIYK